MMQVVMSGTPISICVPYFDFNCVTTCRNRLFGFIFLVHDGNDMGICLESDETKLTIV